MITTNLSKVIFSRILIMNQAKIKIKIKINNLCRILNLFSVIKAIKAENKKKLNNKFKKIYK